MKGKLNELLAKKKHLESVASALTRDYIIHFKINGDQYKGLRKTYEPVDDNPVDYSEVVCQRVITTVDKKLEYYEKHAGPYFDTLMAVEATNSTPVKVDLIYDGKVVANLSSIQLLALKSYLDRKDLMDLYSHLPVRTENFEWFPSEDQEVKGPHIWQTNAITSNDKTSETKEFILEDPNVVHLNDKSKYTPQKTSNRVEWIKGKKTTRIFSGEISHEERAAFLARLTALKEAVINALERANAAPAVESEFGSKKLFDILHRGKV